jgi:hypothetical protein
MPCKTPRRDEFKLEGDTVTHRPTGKTYRADPGSSEIASETSADCGDYREDDIREIAKQLLRERVRLTERLR